MCEGRARFDGLRALDVGVGHVVAMSGWAGCVWQSTECGHFGDACGQCNTRAVCAWRNGQCGATGERSRDWICDFDSAWIRHGACMVELSGWNRTFGMRRDSMGIRHMLTVLCGARLAGQ